MKTLEVGVIEIDGEIHGYVLLEGWHGAQITRDSFDTAEDAIDFCEKMIESLDIPLPWKYQH